MMAVSAAVLNNTDTVVDQDAYKQHNQKLLGIALGLLEDDRVVEKEGDNVDDATTPSSSTISPFAALSPLLAPPPSPPPQSLSNQPDNATKVTTMTTKSPASQQFVYPLSSFPSLSAFDISIRYHAIIVPKKQTQQILKCLKSVMINRPRLRVVFETTIEDHQNAQSYADNKNDDAAAADSKATTTSNNNPEDIQSLKLDDFRKIVLKYPVLDDDTKTSSSSLSVAANIFEMRAHVQSLIHTTPLPSSPVQHVVVGWTTHTISVSYEDWTSDEILKLILPQGCEIPSSMEQIGNIAHLNLRDELLPYKYVIGKVLLDKNKGLKTIVNKVGTIETEYRTFGMEVIAGNDEPGWSCVVVKEEGYQYNLDFQRVYWNSRLGREHQRIVKLIRKDHASKLKKNQTKNQQQKQQTDLISSTTSGDDTIRTVVADMMAGIGPFAIPLTASCGSTQREVGGGNKKTTAKNTKSKAAASNAQHKDDAIVVYANDLNPESYKYLVINAEKNHCDDTKLHKYNMDARAFCHKLQDDGVVVHHFIMNLPKTALEFLDAFRGYNVKQQSKQNDELQSLLPRIHVHCFASKDPIESRTEIWDRCETALGCSLDETSDQVSITEVRDVSPNKNMYCVSFTLPPPIRSLPRIALGGDGSNRRKKGDGHYDDGHDDYRSSSSSSTPEAKRSKLS
jgi:tRNA (guanine37-N1)-methyltransferase